MVEDFVKFGGAYGGGLCKIWWSVPAPPARLEPLLIFFSLTPTVLYESISLLTQSNPIKKAPMKTCSWKPFRGNFYYRPISLRKSAIGSFLPPIVCGLRVIFSFAFGISPSRSRPPSIFRSLSCGAS